MHKHLYLLLFLLLVSCSETNEDTLDTNNKTTTHSMVKAAHYFASAWPKTFWSEFETSQVEADLKQIKNDGFNTIILAVPWMGFETGFQNKKTSRNKKLYQRLGYLLKKIKDNNLDYILRLGFPHTFVPNIGINNSELCKSFYTSPTMQTKWRDYLTNIKTITNQHSSNLSGILVSWEDFWCTHFVFPYLDKNKRIALAKKMGYSQWLMKKNQTQLKIILGVNEPKADEIALPKKDEMAYYYYIDFIDKKFDELVLQSTKKIFPNTAMEIRIDKDPSIGSKGEYIWVGHDLYFDEKNHRGTYWAPFWGAENNKEKLTLKQALFNFEYFLNYVTDNGKSTNHVIEQFNFTDNTPYFPNNASINENEVSEFLVKTIPLLKKYSAGYGVWAYRDYADNALYNASFEMDLDGWTILGQAKIVGKEGDNQLHLTKNSSISQSYNPHERHMLATSYERITLCLKSKEQGELDIYANDIIVGNAILNTGNNCITLDAENFINSKLTNFRLKALTNLTLDEIKLYGFVQKLGVYDEFNKESAYVYSIRVMNKRL